MEPENEASMYLRGDLLLEAKMFQNALVPSAKEMNAYYNFTCLFLPL